MYMFYFCIPDLIFAFPGVFWDFAAAVLAQTDNFERGAFKGVEIGLVNRISSMAVLSL